MSSSSEQQQQGSFNSNNNKDDDSEAGMTAFERAKLHFKKLEIESQENSNVSSASISRSNSQSSKSLRYGSNNSSRRSTPDSRRSEEYLNNVNRRREGSTSSLIKSFTAEPENPFLDEIPSIVVAPVSKPPGAIDISTYKTAIVVKKPELPPRPLLSPPITTTSPIATSSPVRKVPALPERSLLNITQNSPSTPASSVSLSNVSSSIQLLSAGTSSVTLRTSSHRSLITDKSPFIFLETSSSHRSVPYPYPVQMSSNQFPKPPFNTEITQTLKSGVQCMAVSRNVCLIGTQNALRAYDLQTGDLLATQVRQNDVKVTAVAFLVSTLRSNDGVYAWVGFSDGELWCVHGATLEILHRRVSVHSYTITAIIRHRRQMWTIDDNGVLQLWSSFYGDRTSDNSLFSAGQQFSNSKTDLNSERMQGIVSIEDKPKTIRMASKQLYFCYLNGTLWTSRDKTIEVVDPCDEDSFFKKHIEVPQTFGAITALASISSKSCIPSITPVNHTVANESRSFVYSGHMDGKILEWDASTFTNTRVIDTGSYRISSLLGLSDRWLWVAIGTGRISVLDIPYGIDSSNVEPPVVIKSWQAEVDDSVETLSLDPESVLNSGQLVVVSASKQGKVRIFDSLFPRDFRDMELRRRDTTYTSNSQVTLLVGSWNVDSTKPEQLSVSEGGRPEDQYFLDKWVTFDQSVGKSSKLVELDSSQREVPDILVFGLQEIVNLESNKNAAKGFLKILSSSQNSQQQNEADYQSKTKAWKDRLVKAMKDNYKQPFVLIEARNMVGLLIAILVREDFLRSNRISNIDSFHVSTGMGGTYGNKGAIITRFILDNTSFCFITSHLPAHQEKVGKRNLDAFTILRTSGLPPVSDDAKTRLAFMRGGDGSHILDHENVFFSGDLNYRIDLEREKCLKLIKEKNWGALWACDQLIKQRQQYGSTCLLRMFEEAPLRFAPTYKYDRRTDNYDTSEKKRVPAYCDRILFRDTFLHCQACYLDAAYRVPYQVVFPINSPVFMPSLLDQKEAGESNAEAKNIENPFASGFSPVSKPRIQLLQYRRFECNLSDHRPIGALLKVSVKKVKNDEYDSIKQQVEASWEKRKRDISWDAVVRWVMERMDSNIIEAQDAAEGKSGFTYAQVEKTLQKHDSNIIESLSYLNRISSASRQM